MASILLETQDLQKSFGGVTATDHVSLQVEEGEWAPATENLIDAVRLIQDKVGGNDIQKIIDERTGVPNLRRLEHMQALRAAAAEGGSPLIKPGLPMMKQGAPL